jgi:hypothetical protein
VVGEIQKEVLVNLPDTVVGAKLFFLIYIPLYLFTMEGSVVKKYKIMELNHTKVH